MFYFFGKTAEVWWKGFSVVPDEFTDKAIRNYGAYQTFYHNTPPTLDGKLPEEALWKMNQPGFLRYTPERYAGSVFQAVVLDPAPKIIDWVSNIVYSGWNIQHAPQRSCQYQAQRL